MWAELGFPVVQSILTREDLAKLCVKEHPPTSMLVKLLQSTPPLDTKQARAWFEALAGRISGKSLLH